MRTPEEVAKETDIEIIESEMRDWNAEMLRLQKEIEVISDKYDNADRKYTLWSDALQIKKKSLSKTQ